MTTSEALPATVRVEVPGLGEAEVTIAGYGSGSPVLLLHGGAGPFSVAGLGRDLADRLGVQALVPTHPGFAGTPRPEWLADVPGLARLYAALLEQLDLTGVLVLGSSIGGWVAAELALLAGGRLSGLILVDATGIAVPGQPVADVFSLTPAQVAELSFHAPERLPFDPAALTEEQLAARAADLATLATYGGEMADPGLLPRLAGIAVTTVVLWGSSDRICTPEYGKAYAAAIPGARFELVERAGHLPQFENPEPLVAAVAELSSAAATR